VRFTGELYDCRRLVHYWEAMQIFAGHFSQVVEKFEEHRRFWHELGHGEAGKPYRWPVNLELGTLGVSRDLTEAPPYFPLNEVLLAPMKWEGAPPPAVSRRVDSSPVQPENYFAAQIHSGVRALRQHPFCRWGSASTSCNRPSRCR
jgi:hypothetical protein